MLTLTDEQQAVKEDPAEVLCVTAYAGTGKSTVLKEIAKDRPKSLGLYITFNKKVSEEIKKDFSGTWECSTTHAHAYKQIKINPLFTDIVTSPNKYINLLTKKEAETVNKSFIQKGCIDYKYIGGIASAAETFSIKDKIEQCPAHRLSFEDMLVYPTVYKEHAVYTDTYDIVVVDEFQDMNLMQLKYIASIKTKKIIYVGDTHQNIYSFMGSLVNPTGAIRAQATKGEKTFNHLKLTKTFRFGSGIADFINTNCHLSDKLIGFDSSGKVIRTYLNRTHFNPMQPAPFRLFIQKILAPAYKASKDVGILFKTNEQLTAFKNMLIHFGIYDFYNKGKQFKGRGIKDKSTALSLKGLSISTIHSAKGGEFDTCMLYGYGSLGKPKDSETRNLQYVAISRTKRILVLLH